MRRADRLFQIIQILRRSRQPVTADAVAAELETSKRTVYRDISTLIGQRVPIRGEAGIGYVLDNGFDLPPLMLTPDEIEAAVLGAQWVMNRGDPVLARAARDLVAKIGAAVPERLRQFVLEPASAASPAWNMAADALDMSSLRASIRAGQKIDLRYVDAEGRESMRRVWPVTIGYFDQVRTVIGWCELRQDFRSFRTDRVRGAEFLTERYPERPAVLRARWRKHHEEEQARIQQGHAAAAAGAKVTRVA
ncbi:HTH domain protein [Variibacter gotjawalensis]|uniref:HTH domain protein n=1 Tax=Variibacter gotjawalensis TaxID=1333996 RepID=A0A0S3PRB5_9BRAD|nr:YafY family protein [Variibacter gotjawalensis]RZS50658.1 WYL domain-containing protein [Variibacter gotjawalensis]BAT58491.1 HTH domain protein [Variibacter gotjawalensis]